MAEDKKVNVMEQNEKKESTPKVTPHDLIKKEGVLKALEAQQGPEAVLKSWEIQDFTNKGDNYACVVSSVSVAYTKNEEKLWTSFIVKLNPCGGIMGETAFVSFRTEAMFYTELIPEFNKVLASVGHTELQMPKCYYVNLKLGEEIIYLQDMREKEFKMADRKKGLDAAHVNLVLHELARLHASSAIFKGCRNRRSLELDYPDLKEYIFGCSAVPSHILEPWGKSMTDNCSAMLESVEGYEDVAAEIKEMSFFTMLHKELKAGPANMDVICHGDCWTNNILFSYDENGCPKSVCLLDVQIARVASLGTDLNYLIYNSVAGPVRKKNLNVFLDTYYSSFNNVLAGNNYRPLFSRQELEDEFRARNEFGFLVATMAIPIMLSEEDEVIDFAEFELENMEKFMAENKERSMKQMKNNPYFKPRFLDMIDEMIENGVIKSSSKHSKLSTLDQYIKNFKKYEAIQIEQAEKKNNEYM